MTEPAPISDEALAELKEGMAQAVLGSISVDIFRRVLFKMFPEILARIEAEIERADHFEAVAADASLRPLTEGEATT